MAKIFVRQRRHAGEGAGRPRFAVVAVEGTDLHFFRASIRRSELEKIATDTGSQIIYLPRGARMQDEQVQRHEPVEAKD